MDWKGLVVRRDIIVHSTENGSGTVQGRNKSRCLHHKS